MLGGFPHDYTSPEELDARAERAREDPHQRGPGKNMLAVTGAALVAIVAGWWLWSLIRWAWSLVD